MSKPVNKESIRTHLREKHTDADLKTWFDPLHLRFPDEGTLEVCFPHALFSRWFDKERRKNFERDLHSIFSSHPRVVYTKPENAPARRFVFSPALTPVVTGSRRRSPRAGMDGQWSFDTFIYNKKNEFAVLMAMEAATHPQNPSHVPLVIAGTGTCGKTHILRAMAREMAFSFSEGGVYLGTASELNAFFHECTDAPSFRRKMARKKAVFIDNAHELSEYPELQQEIVYITDTFKDKNKPLVLTLDSNREQNTLDGKLRSRLLGGLVLTLKRPDLDIRLRYAKAQCTAMRLHLKKDHLLPIAQRFHNLRVIQGVVAKIAAYEKKSGKSVSSAELQKILAGADTLSRIQATPSSIITQVAEAYSLSPEDITGESRRTDIVKARQVSMYLCRQFLGVSLSSLGRYFNGKNHATVLYACKKIEKTLDSDKDMHKLVTRVRKKFLTSVEA
ncbi:MAG: Chromosomal replication initiator protein DnaA [Desulfovibrio sp.]